MRVTASREAIAWARREFGHAELGDVRRMERLVAMAACVLDRPNGRVSAVFRTDKEREGAYDFLENEHVAPDEMMAAVSEATARRCHDLPFVFVPVDGTSLSLVDRGKQKDFGRLGTDHAGAQGLKVIDALAVDPDGMVVGWLDLTFWTRGERSPPSGTHARRARPIEQKETRYWIGAIQRANAALQREGVRAFFQIDREGDSQDLLRTLQQTSQWWTVRSSADRSILVDDGERGRLRAQLANQEPIGHYALEVRARFKRRARKARMLVRLARVTLSLRDRTTDRRSSFEVTAIQAREDGTTPDGEAPIDWVLFTNYPVTSLEDALLVVRGYSQRWRVEECHQSWKSGVCDVEQTQLHSAGAVKRWSIILATAAARIERLKRLARTQPSAPATIEFTPIEIRALVLLKSENKKRNEQLPPMPTIAQAVRWVAELGGYTGKSSGGPPGANTIRRGLDYLKPAAKMLSLVAGHEK
jgi:hypothetical protein